MPCAGLRSSRGRELGTAATRAHDLSFSSFEAFSRRSDSRAYFDALKFDLFLAESPLFAYQAGLGRCGDRQSASYLFHGQNHYIDELNLRCSIEGVHIADRCAQLEDLDDPTGTTSLSCSRCFSFSRKGYPASLSVTSTLHTTTPTA